jgi:flagellar biosynthesis protein FlhB
MEIPSVLGLITAVMILRNVGGNIMGQVGNIMVNNLGHLDTGDWTASSAMNYASGVGNVWLMMMLPLFGTLAVVGVVGNMMQSGLILSFKPVIPDFSKVNPLSGLKRIIGKRSMMEFAKSLMKLGIVGFIVYQSFQDKYLQIVTLTGSDLRAAINEIGQVGLDILLKAGFALLAVAALDYAYQRWEYMRNIRMTKQEVKEEVRQSEGDPHIRSKIRSQQRQMAARRMMQAVPAADVILTNPTHLAVALQYRPESMNSPKVIAKGELLVAERIKKIAREHGVPVLENKPLAQALYKAVEIGQEIPPALYHAVAEVLAFIFSLKRRRGLGGQPIGR